MILCPFLRMLSEGDFTLKWTCYHFPNNGRHALHDNCDGEHLTAAERSDRADHSGSTFAVRNRDSGCKITNRRVRFMELCISWNKLHDRTIVCRSTKYTSIESCF